jgi:hypothetical protein
MPGNLDDKECGEQHKHDSDDRRKHPWSNHRGSGDVGRDLDGAYEKNDTNEPEAKYFPARPFAAVL